MVEDWFGMSMILYNLQQWSRVVQEKYINGLDVLVVKFGLNLQL